MVAKLPVAVEVNVKLTLPTMDLVLTKEEAINLRDALNAAFPVTTFTPTIPTWFPNTTQPNIVTYRANDGGCINGTFTGMTVEEDRPKSNDVFMSQLADAMSKPLTEDEVSAVVPSMGHSYTCKCDGRAVIPGSKGVAVPCDGVLHSRTN